MRRILTLLVLAEALLCAGCDRKHKVSDFTFKPDLTEEQVEETIGSPTKKDAHWLGYTLEDGNELRLFFVGGKPGEDKEKKRTLTEATIYSSTGQRLKNVYKLRKLTEFTFTPDLTEEQVEEAIGSPSRKDAHWLGYALEDGSELRLFFVGGKAGEDRTKRTLTEAAIFSGTGQRLKNVYMLPPPETHSSPATAPSNAPTTRP